MTELEEGTRLALEGKVFPNEARFSSEFNGDDVAYMFYAIRQCISICIYYYIYMIIYTVLI